MDVKKGTILYVKFAKLGIASKQEQNSHGFVKLYVKFLYLYEHDNQVVAENQDGTRRFYVNFDIDTALTENDYYFYTMEQRVREKVW